MDDFIRCQITQEVFLDPVLTPDKQTYERQAILTWIKKNGNSPVNRDMELKISDLMDNLLVKQMVTRYLKENPDMVKEQYKFDTSFKVNKHTIIDLVENGMYDSLRKYTNYDLKYLIKKKVFKLILQNGSDRVVKHIIDNSLDLDCSDINSKPAWHFASHGRSEVAIHYFQKNRESQFLKSKNYYLKYIFKNKKKVVELAKFVCDNFEVGINLPDTKGKTPFIHLLENFTDDIPTDFVKYFCNKFGDQFDWNKKDNSGNSALYYLFNNSKIEWKETKIFIKHFDPNNKPNFMQTCDKKHKTVLHMICYQQTEIPNDFIHLLVENYLEQLDFTRVSEDGDDSTPFLNLCKKSNKIYPIAYVYDNYQIEKDFEIIEALKDRKKDFKGDKDYQRLVVKILVDFYELDFGYVNEDVVNINFK
jgi:hypothetical protein